MNTNDIHKAEDTNISLIGEETSEVPKEHNYRVLGESGLVEDEEGNLYNASDLSDIYSLTKPESSTTTASQSASHSFFTNKKPKQPDWYAIYDPRYCGPSRETYIEEMERRYNTDPEFRKAQERHENSSQSPTSDSKRSNTSTPSVQSSQEKSSLSDTPLQPSSNSNQIPSSNSDQNPSSDNPEYNTQNPCKIHISKCAILFYIIGALFLLVYFIHLIYKLIT